MHVGPNSDSSVHYDIADQRSERQEWWSSRWTKAKSNSTCSTPCNTQHELHAICNTQHALHAIATHYTLRTCNTQHTTCTACKMHLQHTTCTACKITTHMQQSKSILALHVKGHLKLVTTPRRGSDQLREPSRGWDHCHVQQFKLQIFGPGGWPN